jgi:hypothetical protein
MVDGFSTPAAGRGAIRSRSMAKAIAPDSH